MATRQIKRQSEQVYSTHIDILQDPINSIYGAVQSLLSGREDGVVVHIVSTISGEGASTVAKSLAQKAAMIGNLSVFLMDGAEHGQGSAFSAVKNSRSYLRDNVATEPALNDPAGVKAVYAACRKEYQLTIIDCPSVYSGNFFETIPKLSDGIILVVQAERLRPDIIRQSIDAVEQQGVEIFGIVLNKTRRYIPKLLNKLF